MYSLEKCEYPNSTLKAAIKCGLRQLALKGLPAQGEEYSLDLSWGMPAVETTPKITVTASVTIGRESATSAEIRFDYNLEVEN
ncbi:MAG: hypothetical protein QME05_01255 [Candidatus Margulisbacteria bacterium]|nr:hypothetical protein [Candidatus Margulisiibacteriota bacterium]